MRRRPEIQAARSPRPRSQWRALMALSRDWEMDARGHCYNTAAPPLNCTRGRGMVMEACVDRKYRPFSWILLQLQRHMTPTHLAVFITLSSFTIMNLGQSIPGATLRGASRPPLWQNRLLPHECTFHLILVTHP